MSRPSLIADERGAMFTESVIMLPVIIMLWALMNFVQQGFGEASRAGRNVRAAAWTTSTNQCEDDADGVDFGEGTNIDVPGGALAAATATAAARIGTNLPQTSALYMVAGGYGTLMAFRQVEHSYGQSGDIARPAYIGGNARFGSSMMLRCDEDPPEAEDDQAARIWLAYERDIEPRL